MDSGIESTESSNGSVSDTGMNMADIQTDEVQSHQSNDSLNEEETVQNCLFREPTCLFRLKKQHKYNSASNNLPIMKDNKQMDSALSSNSPSFNSENTLPTYISSERNILSSTSNNSSTSKCKETKEENMNSDTSEKEEPAANNSSSGVQIPRSVLCNPPDFGFQIGLRDLNVPEGCCLKLNFPKIESVSNLQEQATPFESISCPSFANGPLQITTNNGPYTGSLAVLPYESRELQRKFKHYRRKLRQIISTKPKEKKLRIGASLNNVELVERLLKEGVNPQATDEKQRTALHIAASKGYMKIVRLLLQNGADPNQKDSIGNTALHLAACTSHIDTVTLLLKAGTDVKQADNQGYSPLHLANSRLKFLQKDLNPSSESLRAQVYEIVEMMQEYMKSSGNTEEAELLSALTDRLTLSDTNTSQGESDIKQLLTSLQDLTLSKTKNN